MCNYKVLSHHKDGYMIQCNGCGRYQVAFGTAAITFTGDTIHKFYDQVQCLVDTTACNGFETQKRIQVDVFCESAMMILSLKELKKLHNLLEQALFTEEIDLLLDSNGIKRTTH